MEHRTTPHPANPARFRSAFLLALLLLVCGFVSGQSSEIRVKKAIIVKEPIPTVEPGMEMAVKWKWQPKSTAPETWGMPLPEPSADLVTPVGNGPGSASRVAPAVVATPPAEPMEYTIRSGDFLSRIAERFGMTVSQIKKANDMTTDKILVGKKLKIPSLDQIKAMEAPPPQADGTPAPPVPVPVKKPVARITLTPAARAASHITLVQVYLDRQNFSAGPIDGQFGPMYQATLKAYEAAYPGVLSFLNGEKPKVLTEMGEAFTSYTLTREDFRFISPGTPDQTLEQLTQTTFLPYRSAWELVAERFHVEESFLRKINPSVKKADAIGATLLVPNVIPFEIESSLTEPVQPTADPAAPLKATIAQGTRFLIRKGETVIAQLPVYTARPGLRGSGNWMILDAILRPSMTTTGELANPPKDPALAAASTVPFLTLPAGPNNPVGLLWIQLTKVKGTEPPKPLAYGLHGTSIPTLMSRQESIGGFRMANWDIARVARLLPAGTPLTWE
jgi:LysM repeat protein